MKTKSKILLLVTTLLIAMLLFNVNMVQATNETVEGTNTTDESISTTETKKSAASLTQEELNNLIPEYMEVSITKTEYADFWVKNSETLLGDTLNPTISDPLIEELSQKFISLFAENGIDDLNYPIFDIGLEIYGGTDNLENASFYLAHLSTTVDFTIKYAKESNYSTTDETYVKNAVKNIKFAKYSEEYNEFVNDAVFTMYNIGDEESASKWTLDTYDFNKLLNDSSITIKKTIGVGGFGGGTPWGTGTILYFYKNNVLYDTKFVMNIGAYGTTLENGTPVNMARLGKEDEVYKEMAKELEKNGLTNIIGCYELTAYGATYDNMKVSFDIGTNYNGKEVQILHKKNDNTYEILKTTVAEGKAIITVDEFSPFMIALSNTTNNTDEPTNNKVLDNEPKTRCSRLYNICKCNCSYFIRWNSNVKI